MEHNAALMQKIVNKIESEFGAVGLTEGIYMDFATRVAKEYAENQLKDHFTEREETIKMLRSICKDHGDNDWPDDLHLTDIIDKHLGKHLDSKEQADPIAKKKIAYIKTYTVTEVKYEDGTGEVMRENTGFSVFELLGLLNMASRQLIDLVEKEEVKHPVTKRRGNAPLIHSHETLDRLSGTETGFSGFLMKEK